MQNIRNPYHMEDNKAAPSAPPKGAPLRAAPLDFCCLEIGKDFLCFASFPEPILARFSEFVPNLARDPSRIGFSYGIWACILKNTTLHLDPPFEVFYFFVPFCCFRQVDKKWRRQTKMKCGAKMVAMKAVNLSTIQFCTEFLCEYPYFEKSNFI